MLLLGLGVAIWWHIRKLEHLKVAMGALVGQRSQELARASETLKVTKQILENLNLIDQVTGLHNRKYLAMVADTDVLAVLRLYDDLESDAPLANRDLLYFVVGVDGQHLLQSRHGADLVREILKRVAQVLRKCSRETDLVLRMDEEQFLLVARNCTRAEAPVIAERIRSLMASQSVRTQQTAVAWSCSIGFAAFPFQVVDREWITWERVIEMAGACFTAAKRLGPSTWIGVGAKDGLKQQVHGRHLPGELPLLVQAGVMETFSNRPDPMGRRTGEVIG
jgi:diguanylate cyclase (GGDEF)-like protein